MSIDYSIPMHHTENLKELKFKEKPWITSGLKKSILEKNKNFKKYINAKNQNIKNDYHNQFKKLRNDLQTRLKESKTNYYNNYFATNSNYLKATWKGIKNIINLKPKNNSSPNLITNDNMIYLRYFNIINT